MKVDYKGFQASGQSPMSEILAAQNAFADRAEPPHILAYTPVARVNPYQALIYRSFGQENIACAPVLRPDKLNALENAIGFGLSTSLHLHWNAWMTFGETDVFRARSLALGMVGRLERLRSRGINLIWTVHNLYPHDALHLDLELEIQQRIADAANIVHVMSDSTLAAMDGLVKIDTTKIVKSPHPSYEGAYPDFISREEARMTLGLDPDEVVFVLFGAIKAYKGLARLMDAIDILIATEPQFRFRVIVAGGADNSSETKQFINRALLHPKVIIESNKVASDRAQYFLRAADVGLVNYERALNSGAALLYGTFDLPVVAANIPTFREGLDEKTTVFVAEPTPESFARALFESSKYFNNNHAKEALKKHMSALDPALVSSDFAKKLKERF